MKKTVFLKNGPSHNLPKIKYVISEPHEDLLQWNLSWALTFDFLVHQEGSVRQSFDSVCIFESLHNIRYFCCSEASNFCKLDKHTNFVSF